MLDIVFDDSTKAVLNEAITHHVFEDVCSIGFHLELGDIHNHEACKHREQIFDILWNDYAFEKEEKIQFLRSVQEDEEKLIAYAQKHGQIRIWSSHAPDTLCGLYYICYLLKDIACTIQIINLESCKYAFDDLKQVYHWYDVQYHRLPSFTTMFTLLSDDNKSYYAAIWEGLMKENAQLRVFLNGVLCSAPIEFYDEIIMQYIPEDPFVMAQVIGELLQYTLANVDANFIKLRILALVKNKRLKLIEETRDDNPFGATLQRI